MANLSLNIYPGNNCDIIGFSQAKTANHPSVLQLLSAQGYKILDQDPETGLDRFVRVRPSLKPEHRQALVDIVFDSLEPADFFVAIDHHSITPQPVTASREKPFADITDLL